MMVNMDVNDIKLSSRAVPTHIVSEDETIHRTILLERSFKPPRNRNQKVSLVNTKIIQREKMGLPPTPFVSGCRCGHYIRVRDHQRSLAQKTPTFTTVCNKTGSQQEQRSMPFSSKIPPISKSLRK